MDSDLPPALKADLLNDFYAECAEQLSVIRELLALFSSETLAGTKLDETLEALLRNLHSIKGNAAIVGLRPAEELAHVAEDYLRLLTRQKTTPVDSGLDLLEDTAHRLEQIVLAQRRGEELPAVYDLQARFHEVVAAKGRAPVGADPTAAGAEAHRTVVTFSPSKERDERGVNVNAVRQRLSALGKIVKASPQVHPGGTVSFQFTVESKLPLPADPAWLADGLVIQQAEPSVQARPSAASGQEQSIAKSDSAASLFVAPSQLVRVDLSRLDDLLRIAGELVIHRSRLEDRLDQANGDRTALKDVARGLSRSLQELRQGIMRVRLVDVAEVFDRMPFVVRDLARDLGKRVRVVIQGQQTEIDKYVVERVKEPLLHLVRNSLTHGFETTEQRVTAGKPAEGTLELTASGAGGSVVLQIRDDGRGVDVESVRRRAVELGLPLPSVLDDAAVLALICTPGFSTREKADLGAGRGVGMSVVQRTVRELGGSVSLRSTPGQGSCFTLRLPLTLSIVDAFIVSVGPHTCAVPQSYVDEILESSEAEVQAIKGTDVIRYRGAVLPLVRLRETFRVPGEARPRFVVLAISTDRGSTGLVVDRVHGRREVVVRAMNDPLVQVPGVSGATELGDGRPVLILDALALTSGVVRPSAAALAALARPDATFP